jgi:hypothetical protein
MLEICFGVTGLLDPQGTLKTVSSNWDELMARYGRTDLQGSTATGATFWDWVPESEARAALLSTFESGIRSGAVVLDLGTPQRPFLLNVTLTPLIKDEAIVWWFLHGLDITQESVARTALLERERRLRELRATSEKQAEEITGLQKQMERIAAEREAWIANLLKAFQQNPQDFGGELCRVSRELSQAAFVTLSLYSRTDERFILSAQDMLPSPELPEGNLDQPFGQGPSGIAAQSGCASKFDHVLERPELENWTPLAQTHHCNCVWALPLEDDEGLYGSLELFYLEDDKALTLEQYASLAGVCQASVPLLRTSAAWPTAVAPAAEPEHTQDAEPAPAKAGSTDSERETMRVLTAELSEEFSNLLTGVLGHSSLAAAEMGDSHAAIKDVRSIERAARSAARLARKLTALCGTAKHSPHPLDLTFYLNRFIRNERATYFGAPAELSLPEQPCPVPVDGATLEIILDGMADHVRKTRVCDAAPQWNLDCDGQNALLKFSYAGPPACPAGWSDGTVPIHTHAAIPEVFFAREAARAWGGELEICESESGAFLMLTLPLLLQKTSQGEA